MKAKKTYKELKEAARERAQEFINSFADGATYFWSDLAYYGDLFERLGRRYGLLTEFRENGII